ncbi:hypothetical protein FLONG3_452 [Fusarium longipes]|uniref:F-box domain-containing protein n=1 Tax=Fusarium longipes TaxID=694270 RepID=A0A395T9D6_9HYPO|nr:hypothetical protein FLONG3_452 [Fusarium longipes]
MADNGQPDPISLERLPPEILIPVMTALPSLESLWKLLQASPRAWRLFESGSNSLVITEGILSGPQSTIPPKFRELIRGVILVRSGVLHFTDLEEFGTGFMKAMVPFLVPDESRVKILGPESLSCMPRPELIRGTDKCPPAWDREFIGRPVTFFHLGQPTWVEEMRVVRVMWMAQLAGEMQHLFNKKPDIGWSSDDISLLHAKDLVELIDEDGSLINSTVPMSSAMDYLSRLRKPQTSVFYRLPPAPAPSEDNRWITAPPNYNERFMELGGYRFNGKFHYVRKRVPVVLPEGATPVHLPAFTDAHCWEQTVSWLDRQPWGTGISIWNSLHDRDGSGDSPIPGVKFDSFRPLGLAFWDRKRLSLLGLAPGIKDSWKDDFWLFAWESILPLEEVDSIKRRARQAWEERQAREAQRRSAYLIQEEVSARQA